jgi:SAM-dependent methyltransferase
VRLFGGMDGRSSEKVHPRVPRVSSGWAHLLKSMREVEGQRILDIGQTSPNNINFLTSLGHSVYMADLVAEAQDPKWAIQAEEAFPTEAFLAENLNFGERKFDTVLFWDTADYLDVEIRSAVVARLHDVLEPDGKLLGLFHTRVEKGWQRYHLRDDGQVDTQYISDLPVRDVLNNRQIEQLFGRFSSYKFFLAKDNLREVVVTR